MTEKLKSKTKFKCNSLEIFPDHCVVSLTSCHEIVDESDAALKKFGLITKTKSKPVYITMDKDNMNFIPGEYYELTFKNVKGDKNEI